MTQTVSHGYRLFEKPIDKYIISALALASTASQCETPAALFLIVPLSIDAVETSSLQEVKHETIEALSLSSKDWRKAQRADPIISQLLDHMYNGPKSSPKQISEKFDPTVRYLRDRENLEVRDGVLFRFSKFKGQTYKQLLLQENLRMEVLRHYRMILAIKDATGQSLSSNRDVLEWMPSLN